MPEIKCPLCGFVDDVATECILKDEKLSCDHCGTELSVSASEFSVSVSEPQATSANHAGSGHRFAKYPAIGAVVSVLRVCGWVDLIGSVCLALFVLMQDQGGNWRVVIAVASMVAAVWSAIVVFAFAELLAIQVDIERNTASRESND
jgi:hypothetical protein